MENPSPMKTLVNILEWITKAAYLNLLWVLFSFLGLLVIGFFPATFTMVSIARRWIHGEKDFRLFPAFYATFKKEIVAANLIGWTMGIVAIVLFLNFNVLQANPDLPFIFTAAFFLFVFFFLVTMTHVIPVYIHYNVKWYVAIKNAFVIGILNIHMSLAVIVSTSAIYYLLFSYPASALFFLGTILSMIQYWLASRSFNSVQKKADKIERKRELLV